MTQIKAGDFVRMNSRENSRVLFGDIHEVERVEGLQVFIKGKYRDGSIPVWGIRASSWTLVPDHGKVRNTDPDTSKAAAKVKRTPLRERLYSLIESKPTGVVGTGAADLLEAPLNSVTPRFAELRKAGRIKDSGVRLNGQIVWVLA